MSWAAELPVELLQRPLGLIALSGLDTTYNAVHKAIWDSFCNNRRADRLPLHFRVFSADHEYPKCKPKRSNYEPYVPRGVLRRGWLLKHTQQVPALVALFLDLDWDDAQWREKQMGTATKVEILRNSLQNRGTRVCVVLIQKNPPLPPGEDVVATERANSLCSACQLSPKSLYVLPALTDHLLGYTIRLENAFYELVQGYYHTEARRVKAHRDSLNKTTHQLLFIRHQFKIAFFNELKHDTHTALKHYKQAFGHVLESAMHDSNLLEIKTIAAFINYKVCRLSFQHNAPLDAIAQFRRHIDMFKDRVGPPALAFEHSAWMAKQFQVFGELFDEAIRLGLTAIQTQHPGFYFQQAANHARARKLHVHAFAPSHEGDETEGADLLADLYNLDFFGQRPWRQGHQSIEPPDMTREAAGIRALQALEMKEDHSSLIIPLLSHAVQQFNKYKSPRMKRYLMVQMGEEYFHSCEYSKALTLLCRVTWDYRLERWWPPLTSVLHTILRCAWLEYDVQEYVTACLELMGSCALTSGEEKARVQRNLMSVLQGGSPETERECAWRDVEAAVVRWREPPQLPGLCTVEMNNLASAVEVRALFQQESFTADQPIALLVFIRTTCPLQLRFSRLSVLLNSQAYREHLVLTPEAGDCALCVEPDRVTAQRFSFTARPEDVNKTLEVTGVVLELGGASRRAVLHWTGGGLNSLLAPPTAEPPRPRRPLSAPLPPDTPWPQLPTLTHARLVPRPARLQVSLDHAAPALVGEIYDVIINVTNSEPVPVRALRLDFGLLEPQGIELANATHAGVEEAPGRDSAAYVRGHALQPRLAPGHSCSVTASLLCESPRHRNIAVRVHYELGEGPRCLVCVQEQHVSLQVVPPFTPHVTLASMQLGAVESVHVDEPFLLLTDLRAASPWRLLLRGATYSLGEGVALEDEQPCSHLTDVRLQPEEGATELQCVRAHAQSASLDLGQLHVTWCRLPAGAEGGGLEGDAAARWAETVVALGCARVEASPLLVCASLPAYGRVRNGLPLTVTLTNTTPFPHELELAMDASDAFMFCGHKQQHVRVLAGRSLTLRYTLVPLLPGRAALPRLRLSPTRAPATLDAALQRALPAHVFIMPSGSPESPGEAPAPVTA